MLRRTLLTLTANDFSAVSSEKENQSTTTSKDSEKLEIHWILFLKRSMLSTSSYVIFSLDTAQKSTRIRISPHTKVLLSMTWTINLNDSVAILCRDCVMKIIMTVWATTTPTQLYNENIQLRKSITTVSLVISDAKPNRHPDNLFNLFSLLQHRSRKTPLDSFKPKFVAVAETNFSIMFRNTRSGKRKQTGWTCVTNAVWKHITLEIVRHHCLLPDPIMRALLTLFFRMMKRILILTWPWSFKPRTAAVKRVTTAFIHSITSKQRSKDSPFFATTLYTRSTYVVPSRNNFSGKRYHVFMFVTRRRHSLIISMFYKEYTRSSAPRYERYKKLRFSDLCSKSRGADWEVWLGARKWPCMENANCLCKYLNGKRI